MFRRKDGHPILQVREGGTPRPEGKLGFTLVIVEDGSGSEAWTGPVVDEAMPVSRWDVEDRCNVHEMAATDRGRRLGARLEHVDPPRNLSFLVGESDNATTHGDCEHHW